MKKKRLAAILLCGAMVLNLAACAAPGQKGTDSPQQSQSQSAETRTVVDDCGRQVEIPAQVSRIVPSGPLAQIVLFAIAPEMFVGLASEWDDSAQGIIADEYLQLPVFGQLYGSADLNVEELALADPQLIVDIGEPKDSGNEDLDTLQAQTGIPTVYVSATLADMPQTFRTLGKLLGKEEKGEELAQFCQRVYDRTQSTMDQVGENKVDALYILGQEGLNVLAKDSYHAEVMDMLTNNLAVVDSPTSKGTGNEVTMEQIALWNPDFILFAPGSIYEDVDTRDTWMDISAIQNHQYVQVPTGPHNWMGTPPAVQRYLALIWLTAQLYPQYCDYDVKAEVMEYYQLFYGCQLTDEQYQSITAHAFLP